MTTYQSIREDIKKALVKNKNLCMMTREQIFTFVAELTMISDDLTEFIREIDRNISDIEADTRARCHGCSAAMLTQTIKTNTAPLNADKDWANKQLALMKDLRITALAAQRTTE